MSKNLKTTTKLTEFAPLQPEEKSQSVGDFFSKFFKSKKSNDKPSTSTTNVEDISSDCLPKWVDTETTNDISSYEVDITEGRSLPNVLKRISNLLALKTTNLQDYADTDLKQYWMPDSVSKECYECGEKFTTFRRRHHCRVCGQIFCSACCNHNIPGKIFGCTGDLRACTYCCKVVLSYLSTETGVDLSGDLKLLQETLKMKFATSPLSPCSIADTVSTNSNSEGTESNRPARKSVGYQEEMFVSGISLSSNHLSSEEKYKYLQNSTSLRTLFEEISNAKTGIVISTHRWRLKTYDNCFLGSELVDWLICQQKANTRIQALTICQALLEGHYIHCATDATYFIDGYALYKFGEIRSPDVLRLNNFIFDTPTQEEPIWVQQVLQESSNTDSDNEQISPLNKNFIKSSSSYMLNLNVEANTVYLSRPLEKTSSVENIETDYHSFDEKPEVRTSEQRELVPESGWYNAINLRDDNGEKSAYEILTETYEQHEQTLIKQLLASQGLSLTWADILLPLIHETIELIRPDKNHDASNLDIRHYVHIKKLPGGTRKDTRIVNAIVCSKNVAHRGMNTEIENPSVLLLQGAIVYQRTEGRLMALEPVLMQEHEYLRHVAARITSLLPDIVIVQRNVSRLAQDYLRQKGFTLVYNVKENILERLSLCTQADLVGSLDAHIGRPKLGSCKKFYLKSFPINKSGEKTLMFFEGFPHSHLGATILLRGGHKSELAKVKKVLSFILFSSYNWRLERSFLMDEFAQPPNQKCEFFDESKETSPVLPEDKNAIALKNPNETAKKLDVTEKNDDKNLTVESIVDFSDPLQASYKSDNQEYKSELSVAELPLLNKFKKALDDTILSISPYLVFPVPFLETENGKKSQLRKFFPNDIYYSSQFDNSVVSKHVKEKDVDDNFNIKDNKKSPHPFTTAKFITTVDAIHIQNLLANYRACGGRYEKGDSILKPGTVEKPTKNKPPEDKRIDVLDPLNHQRLAVLFCSFCNESNNAPAFCMNPGVMYMDFYGRNDIPLGCFLEKYCFRSTYNCPSSTCEVAMVKHIRRFVHNMGCVSVSLNTFDSEFSDQNIVMWSWCTECQSVSPVVPMSTDTWSFSFAKYLELRFHGNVYSRRGTAPCEHSLHQDHYQYFGFKNSVASFIYSPVQIWEISLPPMVTSLQDSKLDIQTFIDEVKELAQKGHDIFSLISEKLNSSSFIPESSVGLKQLLGIDQAKLKQKIEDVQLKLTSPTTEFKEFNPTVNMSYWKLSDSIISLKRLIVELVESWNARLIDIEKKKDGEKKKDRGSYHESESSTVSNETVQKIEVEFGESLSDTNSPLMGIKRNRSLEQEESETENVTPKGHHRSQSDDTVISVETVDTKKDSDKKSVKNLLSQLLPSSSPLVLIPNPFSPQDHYNLPDGVFGSIVVSENDLSSIIAYALNSFEYKKSMEDQLRSNLENATPGLKKKLGSNDTNDEKSNSLLGFLRNKDNMDNSPNNVQNPTTESTDNSKHNKNFNIDVVFEDSNCNFLCRVYYAEHFAAIRDLVFPSGEEAYIRSLSKSASWKARGGKSGSTFTKTIDDRFILKETPKSEMHLFLESATNYFAYIKKCCTSDQPTLLGKIYGVYQIIFKNNTNGHQSRKNLLVMENLFYNRTVTQKFDLKGSVRNRLVIPDNQEGEIVLLDENLLKMSCDSPLYILPHSKALLSAAIEYDTEFLSSQLVMDYSLLVGFDRDNKELVLGIIDYIRTFTWDKKLETIVKKSGILGGQGKQPTIISPNDYQKRFIEAMHKYFLEVPDHWEGLGKDLES